MVTISEVCEVLKNFNEFSFPEVCLMYKGRLFKDLDALLSCTNGVHPAEITLVHLVYGKCDKIYRFLYEEVEPAPDLDIDY